MAFALLDPCPEWAPGCWADQVDFYPLQHCRSYSQCWCKSFDWLHPSPTTISAHLSEWRRAWPFCLGIPKEFTHSPFCLTVSRWWTRPHQRRFPLLVWCLCLHCSELCRILSELQSSYDFLFENFGLGVEDHIAGDRDLLVEDCLTTREDHFTRIGNFLSWIIFKLPLFHITSISHFIFRARVSRWRCAVNSTL